MVSCLRRIPLKHLPPRFKYLTLPSPHNYFTSRRPPPLAVQFTFHTFCIRSQPRDSENALENPLEGFLPAISHTVRMLLSSFLFIFHSLQLLIVGTMLSILKSQAFRGEVVIRRCVRVHVEMVDVLSIDTLSGRAISTPLNKRGKRLERESTIKSLCATKYYL